MNLCQDGLTGAFCELCVNATSPTKYYSPADDLKVASCELCDASQALVILGFLFGCACVAGAFAYVGFCLYFRMSQARRKYLWWRVAQFARQAKVV